MLLVQAINVHFILIKIYFYKAKYTKNGSTLKYTLTFEKPKKKYVNSLQAIIFSFKSTSQQITIIVISALVGLFTRFNVECLLCVVTVN